MAQTVIGVFGDSDAAQRAAEQLTGHGFAGADVDVAPEATVTTEDPTHEFPENDAFHHFLRAVFSGHPDHVRPYADAARRGSVVTVHTHTLGEAERARDLLDAAGALSLSEIGIQHRAIGDEGSPVPDPEHLLPGQRPLNPTWTDQRSRIVEKRIDDDLRLR